MSSPGFFQEMAMATVGLTIEQYEVRFGDGPGEKAPAAVQPYAHALRVDAQLLADLLNTQTRAGQLQAAKDSGKTWYVEAITPAPQDAPQVDPAADPDSTLAALADTTTVPLYTITGAPPPEAKRMLALSVAELRTLRAKHGG